MMKMINVPLVLNHSYLMELDVILKVVYSLITMIVKIVHILILKMKKESV
jgi:hypothetical protein